MPRILRPSAKAVVLRDGSLLVTVNRVAGDPEGEWLALPGGGQRHGEDLHATLRREVREETGLLVDPGPLLWVHESLPGNHEVVHHDAEEHLIELVFSAEAVGEGAASERDADQIGVKWVPPGGLASLRFPPSVLAGPIGRFAAGHPRHRVYIGCAG